MTQMMKRMVRKKPAVQRVSRKGKKFDPDDFPLEGKNVVKLGLQTAHVTLHNEQFGQALKNF